MEYHPAVTDRSVTCQLSDIFHPSHSSRWLAFRSRTNCRITAGVLPTHTQPRTTTSTHGTGSVDEKSEPPLGVGNPSYNTPHLTHKPTPPDPVLYQSDTTSRQPEQGCLPAVWTRVLQCSSVTDAGLV